MAQEGSNGQMGSLDQGRATVSDVLGQGKRRRWAEHPTTMMMGKERMIDSDDGSDSR